MLFYKVMDTLGRLKEIAYCFVMVESVDNICDILAHINLNIPIARTELRSTVYKVGSEDLIEKSVLVRLIKLGKSVREETESLEDKYSLGALFP